MFQSSKQRILAWFDRVDDLLADHPDESGAAGGCALDALAHHPHRQPLRWERSRRPGAVPARPAVCVSPVYRPAAVRAVSSRSSASIPESS